MSSICKRAAFFFFFQVIQSWHSLVSSYVAHSKGELIPNLLVFLLAHLQICDNNTITLFKKKLDGQYL